MIDGRDRRHGDNRLRLAVGIMAGVLAILATHPSGSAASAAAGGPAPADALASR